jgi:hypothetical protein
MVDGVKHPLYFHSYPIRDKQNNNLISKQASAHNPTKEYLHEYIYAQKFVIFSGFSRIDIKGGSV